MSSHSPADRQSVGTEFVTEAFETGVSDTDIADLADTVETCVATLRNRITSDDRLETLLRSQPGGAVLTSNDTTENEDPEPLTQRAVIEPLLSELGYEDLAVEAGDLSDEYGKQADYSVSLRDQSDIDSNRLLIEAEPLNKPLDQDKHGIGQVEDWLGMRRFDADFGIATDGLRWVFIKYDADTYSFDTLAEVNLQPLFLAAFENLTGRQATLAEWVTGPAEATARECVHAFAFSNFLAIAGDARSVIKETREAITDEFYDDYVQLVFGVVDEASEEATARSLVGDGVVAPDAATGDDVRLFAVGLMNRLIFLKFLEDKGLVSDTLLRDLTDAYESAPVPERFYKAYVEPLFFGVLDERPTDRPDRVQRIDLYDDVPYLNGGLFRPTTEYEGDEVTDQDFDVRDSVLNSIVALLERYSFSADGGPTDLDPSVLGNVFEKTINHITSDAADTQKELGAYYTPDEITRFCAEETVQPALCERFANRMVAEWGWTEEMADSYDNVYALIEALPATNTDVIDDLLTVVDHFRALDPACGSGHFLTSVQNEIVGIRKALYEKHAGEPADWQLYKQTVIENVYGVDIVEPAVEIAKLRLWLSIIAEVNPGEVDQYDDTELALPNVVFNVRQGNSLIGYTELMETTGEGDQAQLDSWGSDSVRAKYGNIITKIQRHKQTSDTKQAQQYLDEAETLLDEYRDDLDEKVLRDFEAAGVEDISLARVQEFEPFHWVLEFAEVYADDGFDTIVGNPPWDQLRATRDDYFPRFDEKFRQRPPSDKDNKQAELLTNEKIAQGWEEYQRGIEIQMRYFTDGSAYNYQKPTIAGRTDPNENNLAGLFLERVFELVRTDGRIAQVLPGAIFNASFSKDLRMKMLDDTQMESLAVFENKGIFDGIDDRYNFGTVVLDNGGRTDEFKGIFQQHDIDILRDLENEAVTIPRHVLERYSPEARTFPYISSEEEVSVLKKILNHPSLNEDVDGTWKAIPHVEIHRTRDSDRFVEDEDDADYPVYEGKNIYQYAYNNTADKEVLSPDLWSINEDKNPKKSAQFRARERQYNGNYLKNAIYDTFSDENTNTSKKKFVNNLLQENRKNPLSESDILPHFTSYRIGFRDITNSTNERTMIASIIPRNIVCVNTIRVLRPYEICMEKGYLSQNPLHGAYKKIFTDEELFVVLGLLNSIPFDFLMRTKVDTHIVSYKFTESQMPRLMKGDEWFEYIWTRAARLTAYGDAFAEMRDRLGEINPVTDLDERKEVQAEIDAAAFHAYGLDREETAFVLDDFHRVQNPRIMTDAYFERVLEIYDELAEEGPLA